LKNKHPQNTIPELQKVQGFLRFDQEILQIKVAVKQEKYHFTAALIQRPLRKV